MNSRFTDRDSLCSAFAIGMVGSTGHPLGIVAAAGMPFVCLMPGTRRAAFQSTFAYYLASLWPLVPGLERYIRQSSTLFGPLALWIFPAILLSVPWTLLGHLIAYIIFGEHRWRLWQQSSLRSGSSALPPR